jgi:hypothetical protein
LGGPWSSRAGAFTRAIKASRLRLGQSLGEPSPGIDSNLKPSDASLRDVLRASNAGLEDGSGELCFSTDSASGSRAAGAGPQPGPSQPGPHGPLTCHARACAQSHPSREQRGFAIIPATRVQAALRHYLQPPTPPRHHRLRLAGSSRGGRTNRFLGRVSGLRPR